MLDELDGVLALRLAHGIEDVGLGDAAEVVVGRRRPACKRHVERERGGEAVGMAQGFASRLVRLAHRVDGEAGAMGEEGDVLARAAELHERIPERAWIAGKLRGPELMALVDGLRGNDVRRGPARSRGNDCWP